MTSRQIGGVWRVDAGRRWEAGDAVAVEEPMEIRVRGRSVGITMRTPGHDAELAAGFLFTEGVIARAADVLAIAPCDRDGRENVVNVQLAPDVSVDFARLTRHVFSSSSCGLCGKVTIEAACSRTGRLPERTDERPLDPALLSTLPAAMRQAQGAFDQTGGSHAAALFDRDGNLVVLREDVGRHNAVDKVIGHGLLNGLLPFADHVLLVSGRTSFEILQKSLAASTPIVASVSAPSSLAVEFAEQSGQTLVGFLRGERMNVYTHPWRLGITEHAAPSAETEG